MPVFPFWRRLTARGKNRCAVEQHDDRIIEHLVSLRDYTVAGLLYYWR